MNIYQSIWMKPFLMDSFNPDDPEGSRLTGGWYSSRYFCMSWALSLLRLRQYYDNITLVSDEAGKVLLIDTLNLPYDNVICNLNNIDSYSPSLWALGKLCAYEQAVPPFLHVDGDVLVWSPLVPFKHKKQLTVQNLEHGHPSYLHSLKEISSNFNYLPSVLEEMLHSSVGGLTSVNAGVLGTNDEEFLYEYTQNAKRFINENLDVLDRINIGHFNAVYEQLLCAAIAKKKAIKIVSHVKLTPQNVPPSLINFFEVPIKSKYVHPLGLHKRKKMVGYQIELRLQYEFPAYHKRILELEEKGLIP